MKTSPSATFAWLKTTLSATALGIGMAYAPAYAADHALIMTIGNYAKPDASLPGIDKDAAAARRMAQAMGITNITELRDHQLTKQGVINAIDALRGRVQQGDGVFIYYSGHGGQVPSRDPNSLKKCTDGLVTHEVVVNGELQLYEDRLLETALNDLAGRAGRLVMMNDSCFSGAAASSKSMTSTKAKQYKTSDYSCGDAINKGSRNLFATKQTANMLYIAAASNRQVAFAGESGSLATVAWAQCLNAPDQNRSGALSGEELRACAQQLVDRDPEGRSQTITLTGNVHLPLVVSNTVADSGSASSASVNASGVLEDIRNSASSAISVELTARPQMRIGQDKLEFSVKTNKPGYLYVLHVGSDGQTLDLLFPNDFATNNQVSAGIHQMPGAGWSVRAGGPVGTSYIMAVVSESGGKFIQALGSKAGPFAQAKATQRSGRNLIAEANGSNQSRPGIFGASAVVAIQEVQ